MYSFQQSLFPLSSTITFPDAPFIQFNPVIYCLSLTICFALRKISFWHSVILVVCPFLLFLFLCWRDNSLCILSTLLILHPCLFSVFFLPLSQWKINWPNVNSYFDMPRKAAGYFDQQVCMSVCPHKFGKVWTHGFWVRQAWREEITCGFFGAGTDNAVSSVSLSSTLLSDSQVSISLVIHGLWWTICGQVKANVVLTCTNWYSVVCCTQHCHFTHCQRTTWTLHCWSGRRVSFQRSMSILFFRASQSFPPATARAWDSVLHIVNTCQLTKLEGGLNLLHEADDDTVIWLESTATAVLAK